MISKSKKVLLLGASTLAVAMTMTETASAAFTASPVIANTAATATNTASANNDVLSITTDGLYDTTGNAVPAVSAGTSTGIQISIDTKNKTGTGILSATGQSAIVEGGAAGTIAKIAITKGTVSTPGGAATIALDSTASSVSTEITIGTDGVLSNTGTTVTDYAYSSTGATTRVLTMTNAGVVSSGGGTAVSFLNTGAGSSLTLDNTGTITGAVVVGAADVTITNSGTMGDFTGGTGVATITNSKTMGAVNIGTNSTSTMKMSAGTVGAITMNHTDQVLEVSGGTTGIIHGNAVDNGKINFTGDVTLGGAIDNMTAITIASGKTVTTGAFSIAATAMTLDGTLKVTGGMTLAAAVDSTATTGGAILVGDKGVLATTGIIGATVAPSTFTVNGTGAAATIGADLTAGTIAVTKGTMTVGDAKVRSTGTTGGVSVGSNGTVVISHANSDVIVDGASDGVGAVQFAAAHTTKNAIGANTKVDTVTVGAFTVTQLHAINAKTINLGTTSVLQVGDATTAAALTGNVVFNTAGAELSIENAGSTVTGALTAAKTGYGIVNINANYTSKGDFGTSAKNLQKVVVAADVNFTAESNIYAPIQLTGTGQVTVNGKYAMGTIDGATTTEGKLAVTGAFKNTKAIGATHPLSEINVENGGTFTAGANLVATNVTAKSGGTLKLSDINIDAGGSAFTAEDGGAIDLGTRSLTTTGSVTIKKGATLSTTLSGAGAATTTAAANVTTPTAGKVDAGAGLIIADGATVQVKSGSTLVEDAKYYLVAKGVVANSLDAQVSPVDSAMIDYTLVKDSTNNIFVKTAIKTADKIQGIAGTSLEAMAASLQTMMKGTTDYSMKLRASLQDLNTESLQKAVAAESLAANAAAAQTTVANQANTAVISRGASGTDAVLAAAGMENLGGTTAVAAGDATMGGSFEVWGRVLGGKEEQNKIKEYYGYDNNNYGFTVGADGFVAEGTKMGLAFSYADGRVKEKVNASKTDVKSYIASVYGSFSPLKTWFVDVAVNGGTNKYKSTRINAGNQTVTGDFSGTMFGGMLSGGYNVKIADGFTLAPFATVQGSTTKLEGYDEVGASGAMTGIADSRVNSIQAGVGAKATMITKLADGWTMAPQLTLAYMHEFSNKARTVNATIGGVAVAAKGVKFGTEIFDAGVGVALKGDNGMSVALTYNGRFKNGFTGHTGLVRFGYKF